MYFDIGANIGRWSQANNMTATKIIAVEAVPATFQKLVAASTLYKHILCENYAVCDNSENDILFYNCTDADTISTLNKDWLTDPSSRFNNFSYNEIICKTITLDALILKYGLPALIKIDVEGGEYECIKSLTQKVPQLCFEWASETNAITLQSLNHLLHLGFTEFYLQFEDAYTFRPTTYTSVDYVREQLSKTTPKKEWGMIWCR